MHVGLSFCQFSRLLGMGWIGLVDPIPFKREKAKLLGADETFAPHSAELANVVSTRGKPLDAVIDAVRSESIINAGLALLRLGGSLCVYGVLSAPTITIAKEAGPLNFNIFLHQWPTRKAEAAAQEPLLEWIRAGKLSAENFVSAEYPVREAARAMAATEEPTAIKTFLLF